MMSLPLAPLARTVCVGSCVSSACDGPGCNVPASSASAAELAGTSSSPASSNRRWLAVAITSFIILPPRSGRSLPSTASLSWSFARGFRECSRRSA
eukprot:scaffold20503_cov101-Isochrysis_galbana.AAC.2